MIIKHKGQIPSIHSSAYIAPNAVVCGNVEIGRNTRVMFGAQVIAENEKIVIGDNCIILENAVIRGTAGLPVKIGDNCLVGPNAHLAGCTLEDEVFIATGAAVFHGATVRKGAEVRVNGVVHLKTVVPEGQTVPIGWVAVGNPAGIFPPDMHEAIWRIQKPLNFPALVYGLESRDRAMPELCKVMAERLGAHGEDEVIE